jgi:S-adenosylmethionine synthetase
MIRFSERVSARHPDKVADFISEYLLDRYLEKDPKTRYAVEVQIKDDFVSLGGEVFSKANFSRRKINSSVSEAVSTLGYSKDCQDWWGKKNTICGDDLVVTSYIGQQSPEIAQGVDNDGWGEQGIFFGMAAFSENDKHEMMPKVFAIARALNHALYNSDLGGLDKTQVVMDDDAVKRVICAIPCERTRSILWRECCSAALSSRS